MNPEAKVRHSPFLLSQTCQPIDNIECSQHESANIYTNHRHIKYLKGAGLLSCQLPLVRNQSTCTRHVRLFGNKRGREGCMQALSWQ